MGENKEDKSTTANTGEGDKSQEATVITTAVEAAQRMEEATEKREALIKREEELFARKQLMGTSEAGSQPVKAPELTPEQFSDEVLKGNINPLKEDGFI